MHEAHLEAHTLSMLARRQLRIGDYFDERVHREMVARLPRCSDCGVPVPLPVTMPGSGETCLYCLRAPVLVAWRAWLVERRTGG